MMACSAADLVVLIRGAANRPRYARARTILARNGALAFGPERSLPVNHANRDEWEKKLGRGGGTTKHTKYTKGI